MFNYSNEHKSSLKDYLYIKSYYIVTHYIITIIIKWATTDQGSAEMNNSRNSSMVAKFLQILSYLKSSNICEKKSYFFLNEWNNYIAAYFAVTV